MSEIEQTPYRYTAAMAGEIEQRWQNAWREGEVFAADNPVGKLAGPRAEHEDKLFILDMFPYPSGKGLHVGHPFGYIATDVMARYHRMLGKNVCHTMGFDAFGLPAEQYAIATGTHPAVSTAENIANMRSQLSRIGFGHDTRREISTAEPEYYRWTQWIFSRIYDSWYDAEAPGRVPGTVGRARPISELEEEYACGKRALDDGRAWSQLSTAERFEVLNSHRLAYIDYAPVNWCPGLGTVLANEEVTNEGRSERGNYPVFKRRMRQWMMRITAYGDRLADDLDTVDWPDSIKLMQRNWIGRSHGALVDFTVPAAAEHAGVSDILTVFTTRPDTLFGATFMVVAPEHPLVSEEAGLVPHTDENGEPVAEKVRDYQRQAAARSEIERQDDTREKTGVFSGLYAINPVNGAQVPIFVADYVLMGYGTGAIMAVPAHDERDHAFALKHGLDIIETIRDPENPADITEAAYIGDGVGVNSENEEISLNGLGKDQAQQVIVQWLEKRGAGREAITYRLRDWLFSRQRYWGEPFPVVYDEDGICHLLPDEMLPVVLPEIDNFHPVTFAADDAESEPVSPLSRATDWLTVELDLGDGVKTYHRDINTMPNWAGSCWYEMRYLDPTNTEALIDPEVEQYWMGPRPDQGNVSGGADLYVGGVEHAVLHLLYARFWHKILFDLGHISSSEPFHKLFNQGYIQAPAFTDARGQYVPADQVEEIPAADGKGESTWMYNGEKVTREFGKMGKSLKNMITPDEICEEYGADTFRTYEMAMGPIDVSRPWDTRTIVGSQRFLQRLWRNVIDEETGELTVSDEPADEQTKKLVARTIADVRVEYDNMRPNTAIAKLIVLNNHLTAYERVPREAIEPLIIMLAPVAPHICEELWHRLGNDYTVVWASFPTPDESKLVEETITCVVQVGGKIRDRIEVPTDITDEDLIATARASERVQKFLGDAEPRKIIVRAPKLISFVPGA